MKTVLFLFEFAIAADEDSDCRYSQRFGITFVEYCGRNNNFTCKQTRTPKMTASWFTEMLKDASFREQPLQRWKTLPECKWHSKPPRAPPRAAGSTGKWIVVGVSCFVVVAVCIGGGIVRRKRQGEWQESTEPFVQATDGQRCKGNDSKAASEKLSHNVELVG